MTMPSGKDIRDVVDAATKIPDMLKAGDEARKAPVGAIVLIVGAVITILVVQATDNPDTAEFTLPGAICIVLTIAAAVWASSKYD
jgi:hypothetical protein